MCSFHPVMPFKSGVSARFNLSILGLFLALISVTPISKADTRGGGGISSTMMVATHTDEAGNSSSVNSIGLGGSGVTYVGPRLRMGVDAHALASPAGSGLQLGASGDLILNRKRNREFFVGAGMGVAGGPALQNSAGLYMRPELGWFWNHGQTAIEAKLNLGLLAPLGGQGYPSQFAGVSVSLLFGDFRESRSQSHGNPRSSQGRPPTPPPPRYNPPPPPPPRHR